MPKCPACNSEVDSNNPALLLEDLKAAVTRVGGWGFLEGRNVGYSFLVGSNSAKIVERKTTPGYPADGYDGAWDQGTEYEASLVIEIGDSYFKKTGTGDSYGDIAWNGDLKPVKVSEKIVKVYE